MPILKKLLIALVMGISAITSCGANAAPKVFGVGLASECENNFRYEAFIEKRTILVSIVDCRFGMAVYSKELQVNDFKSRYLDDLGFVYYFKADEGLLSVVQSGKQVYLHKQELERLMFGRIVERDDEGRLLFTSI